LQIFIEESGLKKLPTLILVLFLLSSFHIAFPGTINPVTSAMAVATPNFSDEVSHGFINGSYGVDLWYVWLNTSGTHLLFLAMISTIYASPIDYFIGQHYFTTDGTEVFVGNRLVGFEIYEDVNKNSVLDADFTNEFNNASDETRYFFMLNASKTIDLTPPSKNSVGNVTHYTWSVKHRQAQGNIAEIGNRTGLYIGDPEKNQSLPSFFTWGLSATLKALGFTFDYWVENSVAYLKTGLEFGTFSGFEVPGPSPQPATLSFGNDSLSALYATSVMSLKPYEMSIEKLYGPQEENNLVNSTSIDIGKKEAFKMVFGENYTLSDDSTTYKSTAGVYPINSLPGDVVYYAQYFTQSTESIFKEQLGQTSPNLSGNVTFSIRKSSLIYRVCYPLWENRTLSHDPLYIAYIGEANFIKPKGLALPQTWLIATLIFGTAVLLAAVYHHKRIRSYKFNSLIRSS